MLDTSQSTAAIGPPVATPTPPPKATSGARKVKIPTAIKEKATPKTPKIIASQGVIFTRVSFQLEGKDGSLENHSSNLFITSLTDIDCSAIFSHLPCPPLNRSVSRVKRDRTVRLGGSYFTLSCPKLKVNSKL